MKFFIITIILCFILIVGCSVDNKNNISDDVKVIPHTIKSVKLNDYMINLGLMKGEVAFMTFDPHYGDKNYSFYLKEWKANDDLKIVLEEGFLKIFYKEKNIEETGDYAISLEQIEDIEFNSDNILIYKNGDLINNEDIKFIMLME